MHVKLKKKYGQNFLIDENIANKIVSLIRNRNLKILEIGPGDGRLTNKIIGKNPKILEIVEIDKELINLLRDKFREFKYLTITNKNILNYNLSNSYDLVISNLPYNISSQVLVKFSLMKNPPKEMILMFQKEFALKLLEKNLNSINSIVNCFFKVKLKFHVSRNCYKPIPNVDSSVLKFEKLDNFLLKNNEVDNFIEFKRYIFSHKRKSLRNLLKKYKISQNTNLTLRAESLNLKALIKIFREINV